jgi:hypothetical protein
MLQLKDLCIALVQCESEQEVVEILKQEKFWDKPENWQYFGGDENNFSIIGNQQSKPEAAIVEKIINSVDAGAYPQKVFSPYPGLSLISSIPVLKRPSWRLLPW